MNLQYHLFKNPPVEYRSIPFWSLNDTLLPAEIERQMEAFKVGGFGGAYLHSRIGLLTEYLEDDWWKAMDAGVRAGSRLGMEVWFYDEDKWPSGFAGGRVPLAGEEHHARVLLRLERSAELPKTATVLAEDENYCYVCYKVELGDPWFNGTCWVDLLNPDTVRTFLKFSYRPYAERYRDQIGTVVKGIFTDEPQVSPHIYTGKLPNKGAVSYSPIIRDDFRAMYGYDFVDHIASLFEDTGEYRSVRLHYFRTIARRMEQSFSKQLGEYCEETGLILTGHYNGEEGFTSVQDNVGNMMMQYRHMQRPGVDHLGLLIQGHLHGTRSLSSVANQYGQERRLSEMFGIGGQNMSFEDRKWIADYHAVLGVNHVCPHLSHYSLKGCRKRDFPPTISPQQPYWAYNQVIEDYMARLSYATTVGKYAAEILVIHPLESAYMERAFAAPAAFRPRFTKFYQVLEALQQGHRDYDLGDEQIIADMGKVADGKFWVGEMGYAAVVLPHMATIRPSTVQLLQQFAAAGGVIVAVEELPQYLDAVKDDALVQQLAGLAPVVSGDELVNWLGDALCPAVRVEGKGAEQVWVHRRILPGGELVLLTNTSRLQTADCVVTLQDASTPVRMWDPAGAAVLEIEPEDSGGYALHLAEAESVLLLAGAVNQQQPAVEKYLRPNSGAKLVELSGPWQGERLDPNGITLDFARYSTDGCVSFSESEPVIGVHERLTEEQYQGPLALAYEAHIDQLPASCSLVVEQPEMYQDILVNGKAVSFSADTFYRDHTFRQTDIAHLLTVGDNTILLKLEYTAPVIDSLDAKTRYGTEIESIYFVGAFAVQINGKMELTEQTQRNQSGHLQPKPLYWCNEFSLTGEHQVVQGDLIREGYPFYSGEFVLCQTFHCDQVLPQERYLLVFPKLEAIVINVELNGKQLPALAWSPWEIDITGAIIQGDNFIKITLVNSLRNLLGPHHHPDGELIRVGPVSFSGVGGWPETRAGQQDWYGRRRDGETTSLWVDDYAIIPFGFLENPYIERRG